MGFYEEFFYENNNDKALKVYVDRSFSPHKKVGTFGCFIDENLKINGQVVYNSANIVLCEMCAVLEGIRLGLKYAHNLCQKAYA